MYCISYIPWDFISESQFSSPSNGDKNTNQNIVVSKWRYELKRNRFIKQEYCLQRVGVVPPLFWKTACLSIRLCTKASSPGTSRKQPGSFCVETFTWAPEIDPVSWFHTQEKAFSSQACSHHENLSHPLSAEFLSPVFEISSPGGQSWWFGSKFKFECFPSPTLGVGFLGFLFWRYFVNNLKLECPPEVDV